MFGGGMGGAGGAAGGSGGAGGMGGMGGAGLSGMLNPSTLSMFAGMFGGGNGTGGAGDAKAAMPYLRDIGQNIPAYFNPYIDAGKWALPQLQQQYGQLLNNPGGVMNSIGAGFQQSPGYQWQANQALGAANRASAAGGTLGSMAEQQNIANTTGQLANQDYYNYLNHGIGMYNTGLQGTGDMAHMGLSATNSLTDDLMTQYLSQANLAYAGSADSNESGGGSKWGGTLSGGLSGAATGSSFGPYGALIGAGVGALGGYLSSRNK